MNAAIYGEKDANDNACWCWQPLTDSTEHPPIQPIHTGNAFCDIGTNEICIDAMTILVN